MLTFLTISRIKQCHTNIHKYHSPYTSRKALTNLSLTSTLFGALPLQPIRANQMLFSTMMQQQQL